MTKREPYVRGMNDCHVFNRVCGRDYSQCVTCTVRGTTGILTSLALSFYGRHTAAVAIEVAATTPTKLVVAVFFL